MTELHQLQSKTVYATFVCFSPEEKRFYRPLDTIGEPRTVVGGGGVVSAHGVQEVVVRRHTHSSSPLGHRSAHAPLVGVRVEALHRPQAGAAVSTADREQPEKFQKTALRHL